MSDIKQLNNIGEIALKALNAVEDLSDNKDLYNGSDCYGSIKLLKERAKAGINEVNPDFPNGFSSWHETHFEISGIIAIELDKDIPEGKVTEVSEEKGTGGLYDLAKELTDKFEKLNEGRAWDGEFFDEIEKFIKQELS